FFETDEGKALTMRVVRDSLQTTDRKKVRYLAAVLAGSATPATIDPLEVEAILNAMAQLTSTDMTLARAFVAQMGRVNVLEGDAVPEVVPNPHFHAARLESAGFIERSANGLRFRTAPYVPRAVLTQLMAMIGPLLSEPCTSPRPQPRAGCLPRQHQAALPAARLQLPRRRRWRNQCD